MEEYHVLQVSPNAEPEVLAAEMRAMIGESGGGKQS
jgi:ABC-type polar amino acid transport system ATPase subunit